MSCLMALTIILGAAGDELPVLPDLPFKGHCELEAAKKDAHARAEAEAVRRPASPASRPANATEAVMSKARDAGRAAQVAQQAAQCAMHCGRR